MVEMEVKSLGLQNLQLRVRVTLAMKCPELQCSRCSNNSLQGYQQHLHEAAAAAATLPDNQETPMGQHDNALGASDCSKP